jgi:hypothetical protein
MRATTLIVSLALVAADPPPASEHAETARWMVNTLNWGGLTTISTRGTATSVGDPFGNPYSFADVGGVPYVYASDLDASMEDVSTIVFEMSVKPRYVAEQLECHGRDDVFVFPPLSRDLEVDRPFRRRRSRPTARTQSSR